MALDTMTWACLFLAAGAGPSDVWHMNTGKFQIPIKVQPSRRSEIKELQLYVSKDQGRTWDLAQKATPDKENFEYFAAGDGLYWFSVGVLDQKGQLDPPNIMKAPIGQKIIVDTKKPEVRLTTAERQGEDVVVAWDARDEYLELATLKVEYRTAESPAGLWSPVPTTPGSNGKVSFRPSAGGPVSVRVQIQDLAGNLGQAAAEITGNSVAAGGPAPAPLGPAAPLPAVALPGPTPVVSNWNGNSPNVPLPIPSARTSEALDKPAPMPVTAVPVSNSIGREPMTPTTIPPPALATDAGVPSRPTAGGRGTMPELKIVNKRQVNLDFEVSKFGPSGLGAMDVYVTFDDGQTWERQPSDGAVNIPPGMDRTAGPVRGTVAVQLPREGVACGFILVAKSRAGLSKPAPQRGDLPQIRVELDMTLPEAKLYEPQADPNKRDTLLLIWQASDRNLTSSPVTLEWAERKEGPWTIIGAPELPNTGKHSWVVPPTVPPNVYLRMTVRDTAGNTSVAQTDKPVLVDLAVPEVSAISLGSR